MLPPKFLKRYFWDINFAKLDLDRSRLFVLKRILEYGDKDAIQWMSKNFRRGEIVKLLSIAIISPKSANFWALIFGIKKENILCFKKHFLVMRRKTWLY